MKLFIVKKAFSDKKVGDKFELDAADAIVKTYVDGGWIEEAPAEVAEGLIAKAIGNLNDTIKPLFEKMAADVVSEVNKGLAFIGPRIDAGKSEAEKRKSFGRQLVLIGTASSEESTPSAREQAAIELQKVYNSKYTQWESKGAGVMVEGSGPNGGYGVMPEYSTDIYRIAIEDTIFAHKARRRPMVSNELRYPKLDQTGTTVAGQQTGYLGGVVAGWANETKPGNQTQAKLKQGVLKAGELLGYSVFTNELLADNAVGLEAMVTELFSEAVAYYIDLATLVGDGADKPLGVANAPCAIQVNRTTANTFKFADGVAMKAKLLPKSMKTAFWVFNQTVMPQLYNMVDGSGKLIWLPNFSATEGPAAGPAPERFLGLPVVWTEKTAALGTTGDVMLVDPQGYMIGDRMGLEIAASPHVNFLSREMTYRFVARVAGQPLLDKPFTMLNGGTLSTFVILN